MASPVVVRRTKWTHAPNAWEIKHNGALVATFTTGQRALAYVDNELRAWEHQQQRKPVDWKPLLNAIGKAIQAAKKDT